jgi:hypothetical protein
MSWVNVVVWGLYAPSEIIKGLRTPRFRKFLGVKLIVQCTKKLGDGVSEDGELLLAVFDLLNCIPDELEDRECESKTRGWLEVQELLNYVRDCHNGTD